MREATYEVDILGSITQYRWCPEEGQYITCLIGSVYDFNQKELLSMGIVLDDRF